MNECNFLVKVTVETVKMVLLSFKTRGGALLLVLCISLSAAFLSGCGCGDNEPEKALDIEEGADIVNRANDEKYIESLEKHRADQKVVARDRNKLGQEMNLCAERVKAGLAADVSEEDFKAALEQDREWQSLQERQAVLDQDVKDVLRESRETVRERLLKEEHEAKASDS